MLPFHCPIEPQEHLLSWLNRVNLLSGNIDFKHTLKYLNITNKPLKACNHNEAFRDCITVSKCCFTDNTLPFVEHTPFALWALSFPYIVYVDWKNNNEHVMPQLLEPSRLTFRSTWQYCPNCVCDDIQKHGHSLWHVKHQLPSVTHCYKHQSKLVSDSKTLLDLRKITLPEVYNFDAPILENEPLLLEWSMFVLNIYEQLNKHVKFGDLLRKRIREYLALPDKFSGPKDNLIFVSLQKKFDEEVSQTLLNHLFLFYSKEYKRHPSVLKSTLGYSTYNHHKHPIYWLIILYWLKDKISLEVV